MVRRTSLMSAKDFDSSFISCERDLEAILKQLFETSKPYSNTLKRLLVIHNKDCLDESNSQYTDLVDKMTAADLLEKNYLKLSPKISLGEHEELKSYIIIEFNSFTPNATNPEYRDSIIDFNIFCPTDYWELKDYMIRPIKIMGYIDGILNKTKLSGIGTLQFIGADEIVLDASLSGYLLRYLAVQNVHEDTIPIEE